MEKSFLAFIEDSIKKNWDLDALTDYKGATLQYKDVARKIEKLHILLEESGIKIQRGGNVAANTSTQIPDMEAATVHTGE